MKIFTGKVISTKMAKTATVAVGTFVVHPTYKKRLKRIKKFHVHDETGAKVDDIVKFVASKPYSRLKRWKIIGIVNKKNLPEKTKKGEKKNDTA